MQSFPITFIIIKLYNITNILFLSFDYMLAFGSKHPFKCFKFGIFLLNFEVSCVTMTTYLGILQMVPTQLSLKDTFTKRSKTWHEKRENKPKCMQSATWTKLIRLWLLEIFGFELLLISGFFGFIKMGWMSNPIVH